MAPRTPLAIGHVHLKVSDLARSVRFYRDILGFGVTEEVPGRYAFMSGGPAHHELALQQVYPASPALASARVTAHGGPGLYHTAFEAADPEGFAEAVAAARRAGAEVGVVDHGISWAAYFDDPDGNGVEVYLDRRGQPGGRAEWGGRVGRLAEASLAGEPSA